jgi:hypothetical protein
MVSAAQNSVPELPFQYADLLQEKQKRNGSEHP